MLSIFSLSYDTPFSAFVNTLKLKNALLKDTIILEFLL